MAGLGPAIHVFSTMPANHPGTGGWVNINRRNGTLYAGVISDAAFGSIEEVWEAAWFADMA